MIKIELIRVERTILHTFAVMLVNGNMTAITLEDRDREITGQPVAQWKVAGETCIPRGTYKVWLTPSPKFGGELRPEIFGVDGFTKTRFHEGNLVTETDGCILVGNRFDFKGQPQIYDSRIALARVMTALANTTAFNPATLNIK